MAVEQKYISRCIELAQKGIGEVAPNPMVGCVIVHDGQIIGEGFHEKYGEAHAEVNAINQVSNQELLKESTMYVSLEPCSHHGKTPPCSDLIIRKQIPRVVIGTVDQFAKIAGRGIEKLNNAGIDVTVGVLENECKELNKRFFTFHQLKRPYIILKWAQTKDGFMDVERESDANGKPTWITNELARKHVHKTRSEEASIMVGTNTAIKDNPSLTVRDWHGKNPVRIVLDRELKIPRNLNLFDTNARTIVFNSMLSSEKKNITFHKLDYNQDIIPQVISYLFDQEFISLIVEGGRKTIESFIESNLWDEAHIYDGPVLFGKGIPAPVLKGELVYSNRFKDSNLRIFKNSNY